MRRRLFFPLPGQAEDVTEDLLLILHALKLSYIIVAYCVSDNGEFTG